MGGRSHRHGDFRHGVYQQLISSREQVMFRHPRSTSLKPILCPRTSDPTHRPERHGPMPLRCPNLPSSGGCRSRHGRLPRWPPAEPGPRPRASVPDALPGRAQRWPAAGTSWRRTRNGQNPRPHKTPLEAVGQARAGRGGGTHRRDLRRPKGPDVSLLASSNSTCMVNSPIRFIAVSGVRLHRIALADVLERGQLSPADRLLTSLLAVKSHQSALRLTRFKSSTGSPRESTPSNLWIGRQFPPMAQRVRSSVRAVEEPGAGPHRNGVLRAELALVYHRPNLSATFDLKIVGHRRFRAAPALVCTSPLRQKLCPTWRGSGLRLAKPRSAMLS